MVMPGSIRVSEEVLCILRESRSISELALSTDDLSILDNICTVSDALRQIGHQRESEALRDVFLRCTTSPDFGGLGLAANHECTSTEEAEILFLISANLEALNFHDCQTTPVQPLTQRPPGRRGMTLVEKIFAAHDVERRGEVRPGDVINLDVDWIIASELSWSGIEATYDEFGKPDIFRNDRLWLAGDHAVDPRIKEVPRIKSLIEKSERAQQVFKLTEYQGMNYTIMHTEFCRERAQPGMLIVGSDSHTCSAGSVSSMAIGLSVADVTLPLVTGETWIKVPETVEIRFINKSKPGLGGKNVILYALKQLKRNTVAADCVVEYTGRGLKYLSCDARFAISNMTTEFGGVTGIFVSNETTREFVEKRKNPKYKKFSNYYRPDDDDSLAASKVDSAMRGSFLEVRKDRAWRMQHYFEMNPFKCQPKETLQQYMGSNLWITTSGNFGTRALQCAINVIGADRVLFSVDYSFENASWVSDSIYSCLIWESDKRKICYENALKFRKLKNFKAPQA